MTGVYFCSDEIGKDVERVEIVEFLERTDSIHVGVEAETGGYAIGAEFVTFPLGKRMDHLSLAAPHIIDSK